MSLALNNLELPVRLRTEHPMTDDEFLRFCAANEPTRFERDANGEILVMSPTETGGGFIETDVTLELGIWARRDVRGRTFGASAGFKLPDTSVRAADAAWVSWKRLDSCLDADRKDFWPICPEFVIEVRPDNDRLSPLQEKMEMWIANGAELAWLIDPERKVIEVYRSGEAPELYENPTSVQGTGPVRGFELVMDRIWG